MMHRRPSCSVLMFAVAMLAAGCAVNQSPASESPREAVPLKEQAPTVRPAAQEKVAELGEYRIGPPDMLRISVWKNEDLSRIVPVRPDGMISLPLVNEVRAAGLTPMELRGVLAKRLAAYVDSPDVSVIIQEVRSFTVSVLGEVKTPGRYELKSRATVLDVVAVAGGFSEFASRNKILILRSQKGAARRISFNYETTVSAEGKDGNFLVEPGDIIIVP